MQLKMMEEDKQAKKLSARRFVPRPILHPLFKNISSQEAEDFLTDQPAVCFGR